MARASVALALLAASALVSLAPATLGREQKKGKKVALLVGVKDYTSSKLAPLLFTENDVEKLAATLETKAGFDEVRLLTTTRGKKDRSAAPTAANVREALAAVLEKKGRHDTVLLAFSGHGVQLEVEDPNGKGKAKAFGFFCPSDADLKADYATGRSETMLNIGRLFDELGNCGAGTKLVIVDACRNEVSSRSLDTRHVKVPEGVAALFSCKPGQRAFESKKLGHGVFFHRVLKGLGGEAADRKGRVTWGSLCEYVTEQVQEEVPALIGSGANQTPHEIKNIVGSSPVLAARAGGKDAGPPPVEIGGGGGRIEDEEVARLKPDEARKQKTDLLRDILLDLPTILQARPGVLEGKDYDVKKGKLAVEVTVSSNRQLFRSYLAQLQARLKKVSLATDEASVMGKQADLSRSFTLPGPQPKGFRVPIGKGVAKLTGPDVTRYDGAWCVWVLTANPRPWRTLWSGYVVDADPAKVLDAVHGDLSVKVDLLDANGGRVGGEEFSLAEDRNCPAWLGAVASRTRSGGLLQDGHAPLLRAAGLQRVRSKEPFNVYIGPKLIPSVAPGAMTYATQRTYRREVALTPDEFKRVKSFHCTLVFRRTKPKEK